MAVFAGSDFRKWRESQGISAADLAERISCDSTTIYRYESGKLKLNPDTAYQICEVLGDISKWCDFMRTEYPISYGRIHPEQPQVDIRGALLQLYAEMSDMERLRNAIFKDAADAHIDDEELRKSFCQEITDLLRITQRTLNILQNGGSK